MAVVLILFEPVSMAVARQSAGHRLESPAPAAEGATVQAPVVVDARCGVPMAIASVPPVARNTPTYRGVPAAVTAPPAGSNP